jgi:glycerophosphoryl diester phosphodiesterase
MDAYLTGADFIKLTVQMTSDQILVVNSDACLRDDTNAGQVWAQNTTMLARLQNVNNFTAGAQNCVNDYVIPNLTLSQIKQLRRV